jgi:hypothetical protein
MGPIDKRKHLQGRVFDTSGQGYATIFPDTIGGMDTKSLTTRRNFLGAALILPSVFALAGCGSGSGGDPTTRSVAATWSETLLNAISGSTIGPPMNARAIAIVATAMFDAWACYDAVAVGTRLGATLRRPAGERTQGNKDQAVSYAAYRALVDLYPAQKATFDAALTALGYDPANASTDTATAIGIGNKVAQELLSFRHGDGSNHLNNYADTTGYVPVNTADTVVDPKYWQQIRFPNGKSPAYIGPHWGNVIPFALTSGAQFRSPAPPEYGSTEYMRQLNEVVQLTLDLTTAQRKLVEYWADGPRSVQPPGHWVLFALEVSRRDGHDLDKDIKMFFVLGNAEMDAGIGCWETKRHYNLSRPITAIRALTPNSTWVPAQADDFLTPPFPEYTSGHSTYSAAGAEVLKRFTGSDLFLYDPNSSRAAKTRIESLLPTWQSFSQIAEQAGASRRYGGIHFETADIEGRKMGRTIGAVVWDKAMSYINGTVAG